jgi:hypothetical protein
MDGTNKTYRILQLGVENYKRLKAVDVTPGRNAVVVSGRNKQGKSSLLDAIAAALGGKKQMATRPLREGSESGQIVCVLGDAKPELLVKRIFTQDGKTALEITSAEGYKAPTPQAILDGLYNAIAFDPISFTRMEEKKQLATLRQLVGLDFSDLDAKRKQLYDARTDDNRSAAALAAQAAGIEVPINTPTAPVSIGDLRAEQRRRLETNRHNQVERDKLMPLAMVVATEQRRAEAIRDQILDLTNRLDKLQAAAVTAGHAVTQAKAILDGHADTLAVLEDQDVMEVQEQVLAANAINASIERQRTKTSILTKAESAKERAAVATRMIDEIDANKAMALAQAAWPIDGLTFGDDGVLYNNLPFDQASGAEQLAVSFAISAAMNPKLRVALVRDASLLDPEQMGVVQALAQKYDMQVWLEVVSENAGPCGILIEDGECAPTKQAGAESTTLEPEDIA